MPVERGRILKRGTKAKEHPQVIRKQSLKEALFLSPSITSSKDEGCLEVSRKLCVYCTGYVSLKE